MDVVCRLRCIDKRRRSERMYMDIRSLIQECRRNKAPSSYIVQIAWMVSPSETVSEKIDFLRKNLPEKTVHELVRATEEFLEFAGHDFVAMHLWDTRIDGGEQNYLTREFVDGILGLSGSRLSGPKLDS